MSVDADKGEWSTDQLPPSWTWVPCNDFWVDHTDAQRKVPQNAYLAKGALQVVDQGADLVGGFTDDIAKQSRAPLPVIVFGDHTRAVKYVDRPFVQGADGVRVLCAARGVEPLFAYHALRCVRLPDKGYSRHFKFLKATQFPLAPLAEQQRIVAKIGSLSQKSRRARDQLGHMHRLVEKYKQAILAAAFRGDLTREWRQQNPDEPVWQEVILKEIAEIQSGIALGKKRAAASQLIKRPYLRVANVQRGWLDLEEIKEIEVTEQEAWRLYLRPGDILMNEGGDRDKLGRGWFWEGQIENCIHQNHVFRVRLYDPAFPPKLISLYANELGQAHFFDEGTQTTNLASISKTRLSSLPLRLPPTNEAREILARIEIAFSWIDRLATEATSARKLIDHLDQSILAKAFRGELVPQDPNDEPASVLLERIKLERQVIPNRSVSKIQKARGAKKGRRRASR
jgi:type I restriction enzyme S subunit